MINRVYDDRIAQVDHELDLLSNPNCSHPEYVAQMRCVDDRRDERLRHEHYVRKYKRQALDTKLQAERAQMQSQYCQSVRDIRDRALDDCGRRLIEIQKGRRRWGADEKDYVLMFNPKRSQQIRYQTAINMEVSILSGVAKYVGFPAAPGLRGASATECEEDLRAMTVSLP
jgi:hypothetical protein